MRPIVMTGVSMVSYMASIRGDSFEKSFTSYREKSSMWLQNVWRDSRCSINMSEAYESQRCFGEFEQTVEAVGRHRQKV